MAGSSADRLVDGDELGAVRERRLDLDVVDHLGDAVHDLAARDDMRPGFHQIGDGASVPRALDDVIGDESDRLGMIELDAPLQPLAGDDRRHGDQQLVLLPRCQNHRSLSPVSDRSTLPHARQRTPAQCLGHPSKILPQDLAGWCHKSHVQNARPSARPALAGTSRRAGAALHRDAPALPGRRTAACRRHGARTRRAARQYSRRIAVDRDAVAKDQASVEADAPAVDQRQAMYRFPHLVPAEDQRFGHQRRRVAGQVDVQPAVERGTIEEDRLLRQPVERRIPARPSAG